MNRVQQLLTKMRASPEWSDAQISRREPGLVELANSQNPFQRTLSAVAGGHGLYRQSDLAEIDTAWQPDTGAWQYKTGVVEGYVGNARGTFNAGDLIQFTHESGEWVIFDPQSLNWINQNNSQHQIATKQPVVAQVSDDTLSFPSGYGPGRHFQYVSDVNRLAKLITIDNLSDLPTPTVTGTIWLTAEFTIKNSPGIELYLDGVRWPRTNNVRLRSSNRIELRNANNVTLFHVDYPRAWDSAGNETTGQFEVRRSGGNYFCTVRIPREWLLAATYPVFIDPTIDTAVSTTADDGMWLGTTNYLNDGQTNNLGQAVDVGYTTYFRVTGISISGSVNSSTISVFSGADSTASCYVKIRFEDADSPTAASSATDGNARTRTSASVVWNIATASWTNNVEETSPDISPIIQELVDSYTISNDALQCFIENNGSINSSRTIRDYTNSAARAPSLQVTYTTSNASPTIAPDTADGVTLSEVPTLEFTGTDTDGDDLTYRIQISTDAYFSGSSGVILADHYTPAGGGLVHPNPTSLMTWQGNIQLDDRPGQSFTGCGGVLDKISFKFNGDTLADGYALVRVYAHEGLYGASSQPLNAASPADTPTPNWLAQSASYHYDSTASSEYYDFAFSGANRIRLSASTYYVAIIDWIPSSSAYDNTIEVVADSVTVAHPGNAYIDGYEPANNRAWPEMDMLFNVYEEHTFLDQSSSSDSGFLNTGGSADTDPFTSGCKISYTVPSGSALAAGTRYFWRAQAKDPTGSSQWSSWTASRSFYTSGFADAYHSLTSDHITLTQEHILAIADALHAHTADNLTLASEGATDLVIADSTHAHTSDALVLVEVVSLVIADSTHSHTADALTLTEIATLTVADSTHAVSSDSPILVEEKTLVVADATHALTSDNITLVQVEYTVLVIADATHAVSSDNLDLVEIKTLTIADALHAVSSDAVVLSTIDTLAISDSTHSHAAENISFGEQTTTLSISDSTHALASDNLDLVEIKTLVIADSTHSHLSDAVTLSVISTLAIADTVHAHSAETPSFDGSSTLAIFDATHAHTVGNIDLTGTGTLAISDATHAHVADAITLSVISELAIADSIHAHAADAIALDQTHNLAVDDTVHAHTADNVSFGQDNFLVIADALHAHTADALVLGVISDLIVADALHAHLSDALTLTAQDTDNLVIADATHSVSSDLVSLSQIHNISISDTVHAVLSDVISLGTLIAIANVTTADFAVYLAVLSDGVVNSIRANDAAVTGLTLEEL